MGHIQRAKRLPNVRHSMNNLSGLHTNDTIEVTNRVHNCTLPNVVIKIIHLVQTNIVLFAGREVGHKREARPFR
jgi:hypothetical protein